MGLQAIDLTSKATYKEKIPYGFVEDFIATNYIFDIRSFGLLKSLYKINQPCIVFRSEMQTCFSKEVLTG